MTECSSDRVFKPLAGIRVADFSWVIVGPWLTKILACFGAEVIRIESRSRPDAIRLYHDPEHSLQLDWTARFSEFNAGKLGISLDLRRPEAQEIAKRLVAISDIVIENFSLYGMQKFGLEYDVLREVNPHLIMLSMQAMGRSGPHKEYVTFGPNLLSLTGLDRPTRVRHLFKPPAQPRVPRSPSECVDPATLGRRGNAPSTSPRRPCGCRATHRRSHGTRSPPAGSTLFRTS
jgi:crotonobetainyl-CoA:carnitine CoA-transferase CaiB-like acyl-CoA transferase